MCHKGYNFITRKAIGFVNDDCLAGARQNCSDRILPSLSLLKEPFVI